MATVEIPDDVFEALRLDSKTRLRTDDPTEMIIGLARGHLREACAAGFDHDGLTGLLTRQRLRERISRATFGTSADTSRYRERFLCVDLDNFKRFLDVYSLLAGDHVLQGFARQFRDHYGPSDVYRFGGDEFVAVLGDRDSWLPDPPADVTLAYSVVEVSLRRNQRRNHHVSSWIELHLDAGIIASTPEGTRIECGDPIGLRSG